MLEHVSGNNPARPRRVWRILKTTRRRSTKTVLSIFAACTFICGYAFGKDAAFAGSTRQVQLIGLAPLYEALFAVANCPNVAVDETGFVHAAHLYDLSTADLTADGPFAPEIAALTDVYRVRLDDDRAAFCSVNRLSFAIPHGVLLDRGPVVPHPLPFGRGPVD